MHDDGRIQKAIGHPSLLMWPNQCIGYIKSYVLWLMFLSVSEDVLKVMMHEFIPMKFNSLLMTLHLLTRAYIIL